VSFTFVSINDDDDDDDDDDDNDDDDSTVYLFSVFHVF